MSPAWLDSVLALLDRLGLWGLAVAMALECAGLPVPSELLLPMGGLLAARGRATVWSATLAATAGGLVGSFALYAVARWGGRPLLLRVGRCLSVPGADWQRAEGWFRARGEWAVFACRMVPGLRTMVSIPAGAAAMPAGRFLYLTFLGSLPWCFALIWAGYLLGDRWAVIRPYLALGAKLLPGVAAFAALWWWWRQHHPARSTPRD